MKKPIALIADDEPDILQLLQITLARIDINCICVQDIKSAKRELKQNTFDICLTDMRLPDGSGLELVTHCQKYYTEMPIAVLTAHGNMELAIKSLKLGAFDFLSKPVDLEVLRGIFKSALNVNRPDSLQKQSDLVGNSAIMQSLKVKIAQVAKSQAPIFIYGESGTGKELIAHMLHMYSTRSAGPFIPVNCGAIPTELLESELFGHIKGSFTSAVADKEGLFQLADKGTLFLDEIAELPLHMQVKLLRAIQEKAIRPIGSQNEHNTDIRIVSATNQNIQLSVQEGRFREDLFYRIDVIRLDIPPLRDRSEDIEVLSQYLLTKIANKENIQLPKLSVKALKRLKAYSFPGNVRELENILESAIAMCESNEITASDLNLRGPNLGSEGGSLDSILNQVEKHKILDALKESKGNKTAAARLLGISFRALRYRLDKLKLD